MNLQFSNHFNLSDGHDGAQLQQAPAGLEEARRVQQHLFPRELPRLPGWELAAAWRPARAVSGDYYNLFPLGPGRLALALGDVSGKGLGPALVTAGVRAWIRVRLPQATGALAGLLEGLNHYLLATTPEDMFLTLFLGVLDLTTGRLTYANAGHVPPLVLAGPEAEEALPFTSGGPVLGILPGACFESGCVTLRQGCLLALFSDGLPDATNTEGKMFHTRRVVAALRSAWPGPVSLTLDHLLAEVEAFQGSAEAADDLAVVLLHQLPE
jgi:sigma-B regulation protein RsbU (phosphoserine phosphatase)